MLLFGLIAGILIVSILTTDTSEERERRDMRLAIGRARIAAGYKPSGFYE